MVSEIKQEVVSTIIVIRQFPQSWWYCAKGEATHVIMLTNGIKEQGHNLRASSDIVCWFAIESVSMDGMYKHASVLFFVRLGCFSRRVNSS
jgi:hypothetical protein